MLGLMGSTAAAITLAGCGGSEQSGSGASTSSSTAETTNGAGTETASTTCVVRPEQTEGPYYVDTGLDRSDIREKREGVPLELTFNVSRVDEGDASDRKSTRLNSSHANISYAVFCLKKKKNN